MNDKNSDDDILQDIDIDIPYINNNTNKHNGNERDSIEIAIESQPISTTTANPNAPLILTNENANPLELLPPSTRQYTVKR
jgi:hypothetical protein